jgi:LAGLIDADG endonuclease
MDIRDKAALYEIKHKYGGSIKSMSGANASRYKLRHKKGIIDLINDVNGLIRNPIRLLQLNKLCVKYNINLKEPKPLTYNNGWFSGLLDSDGSIYFNEKAGQLYISVTQKNKFLLEPLRDLYGGKIYILSPKIEAFKYTIYRKTEVLNLIDDYLKKYPLKTAKSFRVQLAKDYYLLREYKNINVNHMDKYSE